MPILTFISRLTDGLLLVASMENISTFSGSENDLNLCKVQAKQILKKLGNGTPCMSMTSSSSSSSTPSKRVTLDGISNFAFHYSLQTNAIASDLGLIYLTLTTKSYPKKLAFCYLDQLQTEFLSFLQASTTGSSWENDIRTIGRPYAYIKFDKVIQKISREYCDPSSRENMNKLNNNLNDIQNIMRQNIQEVLSRGEKIGHVSQMSTNLADRSKDFKWGAKKINLQAQYRKYGPLVAVGFFILFIIYVKFIW